jgi:hypothetical protein
MWTSKKPRCFHRGFVFREVASGLEVHAAAHAADQTANGLVNGLPDQGSPDSSLFTQGFPAFTFAA